MDDPSQEPPPEPEAEPAAEAEAPADAEPVIEDDEEKEEEKVAARPRVGTAELIAAAEAAAAEEPKKRRGERASILGALSVLIGLWAFVGIKLHFVRLPFPDHKYTHPWAQTAWDCVQAIKWVYVPYAGLVIAIVAMLLAITRRKTRFFLPLAGMALAGTTLLIANAPFLAKLADEESPPPTPPTIIARAPTPAWQPPPPVNHLPIAPGPGKGRHVIHRVIHHPGTPSDDTSVSIFDRMEPNLHGGGGGWDEDITLIVDDAGNEIKDQTPTPEEIAVAAPAPAATISKEQKQKILAPLVTAVDEARSKLVIAEQQAADADGTSDYGRAKKEVEEAMAQKNQLHDEGRAPDSAEMVAAATRLMKAKTAFHKLENNMSTGNPALEAARHDLSAAMAHLQARTDELNAQ